VQHERNEESLAQAGFPLNAYVYPVGNRIWNISSDKVFFTINAKPGVFSMDVALVQLEVSDRHTKKERFHQADIILQGLRDGQAPELIVFPEIWGAGFFNFPNYAALSEEAQGETYAFLAPWAEKLNCHILGGSMIERDGGNLYNTSLLIDPRGKLIHTYRKIHLFGYQSQESELLSPGTAPAVVKTELGVLGITTCYDLRFPELYRRMVDDGAEIFLVVAAWPQARLEHWVLLNRVRALENLCYLVSCNCAGSYAGQTFAGNSMIVDPWGTVTLAADTGPTVLRGQINPANVAVIRSSFPALQDRVL
jgi:predicted amidohydrolase